MKKLLRIDPCVWLGFSGVTLDEHRSQALSVPQPGGILVQHVAHGDVAERGGLRGGYLSVRAGEEALLLGGDVILRVDGVPALDWLRAMYRRACDPASAMSSDSPFRAGQLLEIPIVEVHREGW